MQRTIFVLVSTAALAACGGPQDGGKNEGGEATTATATTSGWDATNACARLDKAALGAALDDAVTETDLGLVHQATAVEAATSECTYRLASGGDATLMTRWSPIADNTPEAIAQTRKATAAAVGAFSDKPVEDVPGLGKAAFFVPGINQMNVFLDERRFVILTIGSAPRDRAKDIAADLVGTISR